VKITKIKANNYRLLKDFELDLEEYLSLVIGKNNCGKTSLLSILDKFIGSKSNGNSFTFDDFNSEFKDELKTKIESNDDSGFLGLSLKLFIEYDAHDDLSNVGNTVMMDLDPNNTTIVLAFEYKLEKFHQLLLDFTTFKAKEAAKGEEHIQKDIFHFLKNNHKEYFKIFKKTVLFDVATSIENDDIFIDLIKENIRIDNIINFKLIDAKRNVSNKEPEKSLSSLSSKIYKKVEASEDEEEAIEKFKDTLSTTDDLLDDVYAGIFKDIIEDIKQFGGIKKDDSNIKIVSTLQHRELLEGNTTVMYDISGEHALPENYNGLGYMNLISMIFEIKILLHEFQKEQSEKPADINLLFIEEPEAHTHPQMQYIFIENIKTLLSKGIQRDDRQNRKLQTIISTHSTHIASKSDFHDIKYFKKENNRVVSKNLKDLEKEYVTNGEELNYKFLKQYLTLHRAELFFADKAIFIEGDTERILLPAMMKKIDQESSHDETPLLSQNISIVEVGAYAHIFEKFIDFIGVKSLVITDIDSYYEQIVYKDDKVTPKKHKNGNDIKETVKCPASDNNAMYTSNASLKFFYGVDKKVSDFITFTLNEKKLKKDFDSRCWVVDDDDGYLICIYQVQETNIETVSYHARSFEDAFFHINKQFFYDNLSNFPLGLKNTRYMNKSHDDYKDDVYYWAEHCVDKKPALAMEILLNSKTDGAGNQFSNWNTPQYIKEGLTWLKQD